MAFSDIFKTNEYKAEIERLKNLLTPEMKNVAQLQNEIANLSNQKTSLENQCSNLSRSIDQLNKDISLKKSQLIEMDDDILLQDFGLYTPIYNLMSSDLYKERIQQVRQIQKDMIKDKTAATGSTNWTVDGSRSKGKAMINSALKGILRSFNSECDALIGKAKFNNIESIRQRIVKSFEALNKINDRMNVAISSRYLNSKLDELNLCYEYELKKQDEKEAAREERERLREEAKLRKEIEEARKNIEKEKSHYSIQLDQINERLKIATGQEKKDLEVKRTEILNQLGVIQKSLEDIDYREANKRAGYVYIISNIGSFGKNVYKIGMTRRLEPMDRVKELGDASVPFNFDVHAMIFSDDAPGLESQLHKAFESRKLNIVNSRREFFYANLDDIEKVVKQNHDKTVDFKKTPEAEQYRETIMHRRKMKEQIRDN